METRPKAILAAISANLVIAGSKFIAVYFSRSAAIFSEGILALDILFRRTLSANEVASEIDRIEKSVRTEFPKIRHIYLEADGLSAPVRSDGTFTAQYRAERIS